SSDVCSSDLVNEATPLMVGGVLYVSTSLSQVAAIDAATGQTLWTHDPEVWKLGTPGNLGWVHRGVAYWTDGREARIFIGTGNAFLVALDARTGKPITGFGNEGRIDLTAGLGRPVDRRWYSVTSPPVVVRDVVVVGASIIDFPASGAMPPGHVRGFDARTGEMRWIFHAIPQAGETGNETWEGESWRQAGAVNVWAPMRTWGTSTCRSARRPTTTTGAVVTATTSSVSRSSAWRPRRAGASGTTRSSATVSGTTTSPLRRTSSTSRWTAVASRPWPRSPSRGSSSSSTA